MKAMIRSIALASVVGLSVAMGEPFLLDPGFPSGQGPDHYVRCIAIQKDGRVLITGDFTNVSGFYLPGIARLLPDGSLDNSFATQITNRIQGGVRLMEDGSILVSGYYTDTLQSLPGVAKLTPNGAFDDSFALPSYTPSSARVGSLYPASGGKLWLTGSFTNVSGHPTERLARLNADGSVDPTFRSPFVGSQTIGLVVPLPDGKLLVSGSFTNVGGTYGFGLVRLNHDGCVDTAFVSALRPGEAFDRLAILPDGRVLALWKSQSAGELFPRSLIRLLPDGAVDSSYQPSFAYPSSYPLKGINLFCAEADGSVLVFGYFVGANGVARPGITRLLPDGETDLCYDPGLGISQYVLAAEVGPDGSVYVGGTFNEVECQPRPYLARLRPPRPCAPATIEFGASGTRVSEDSGEAVLSVTRRGGEDQRLTVGFETLPGTATPREDFQAVSGTLVFEPGVRSAFVCVPIMRDTDVEPEETFLVRLGNPSNGATLGAPTEAEVTIVNYQPRAQAGLPDAAFRPAVQWPVNALLRVASDAVLVAQGGWAVGSDTGVVQRVLSNGMLDPAFQVARFNGAVKGACAAPKGGYLVGGQFSQVNGKQILGVARLESDGALDETYNPLVSFAGENQATVEALLCLEDGSLLLAGAFRMPWAPFPYRAVIRVTDGGTIDADFAAGCSRESASALVPWPGRGCLVGISGPMFGVLQLMEDGIFDPRFVTPVTLLASAVSIAWEVGGSLLAAGSSGWPWQDDSRPMVVRLNWDGSLAADLAQAAELRGAPTGQPQVKCVVPMSDGKVLIGGAFVAVGGLPGRVMGRLHPNGRVDYGFDTGPTRDRIETGATWTNQVPAEVRVILPLPEGGWLVGGDFAGFGSLEQPFLVKLQAETPGQPAAVQLVLATNHVSEGAGALSARVIRQGDASQAASVRVLTHSLNAGPGVDFEPLDQTLEFGAGEWAKDIAVHLIDDRTVGLDVAFDLTLTNASPGLEIVEPASQTIVVCEDDVNVEFADTVFTGSEDDGSAIVALIRYGVPGASVAVRCRSSAESWTTLFPAMSSGGTKTNYLSIPVVDDAVAQGPWNLALSLEIVEGTAWLGPRRQATVLVADNDFILAPAQGVAGVVNAFAPGPGGSVYVAGEYTAVHGVARRGVARLLANGTVDPAFDPAIGPDGSVTALATQPDGRPLIAGEFGSVGGRPRTQLARLNTDGSLDETFNAGDGPYWVGTGRDEPGRILALAVQPDGKILVGGRFSVFNRESALCLVRLEPNGRPDPAFRANLVASPAGDRTWPLFPSMDANAVRALALQPDGRILVGGQFGLSGWPKGTFRVSCLKSNGQLDSEFAPLSASPHNGYETHSLALQSDGGILVGSAMTSRPPITGLTNWLGLGRLNSDGRADTNFQVRGLPEMRVTMSVVRQLHAMPDNSVLVLAAYVTSSATKTVQVSRIGRVLSDGSWDTSFASISATNPTQRSLRSGEVLVQPTKYRDEVLPDPDAIRCMQPAGQFLVVGGAFSVISDEPRRCLARFDRGGMIIGRFALSAQTTGPFLHVTIDPDVQWPYAIEVSPDLADWYPVTMNVNPWAPFTLDFPASAPRLYLRAAKLP